MNTGPTAHIITRRMIGMVLAMGTAGLGSPAAHATDQQVPFRASYSGLAVFTSDTTVSFDGAGKPAEFGVKTRTSRRTVELDQHTRDVLVHWRHRLRHEHLPHDADDWMFCNTSGRFLNPESIAQLFDRIVQRSDVPRIRFHDLRHTHASLLVADGVAIKIVSERLGHAHPAFTMDTYQHQLPGMSATAAEQFANLVATAGR